MSGGALSHPRATGVSQVIPLACGGKCCHWILAWGMFLLRKPAEGKSFSAQETLGSNAESRPAALKTWTVPCLLQASYTVPAECWREGCFQSPWALTHCREQYPYPPSPPPGGTQPKLGTLLSPAGRSQSWCGHPWFPCPCPRSSGSTSPLRSRVTSRRLNRT